MQPKDHTTEELVSANGSGSGQIAESAVSRGTSQKEPNEVDVQGVALAAVQSACRSGSSDTDRMPSNGADSRGAGLENRQGNGESSVGNRATPAYRAPSTDEYFDLLCKEFNNLRISGKFSEKI